MLLRRLLYRPPLPEEALSAEITAYSLPGETGAAVINSTAGTISVTMPTGTNVTNLVGTFTTGVASNSVKDGLPK